MTRRECHFEMTEIARLRSAPFQGDRPSLRELTENETLQAVRGITIAARFFEPGSNACRFARRGQSTAIVLK